MGSDYVVNSAIVNCDQGSIKNEIKFIARRIPVTFANTVDPETMFDVEFEHKK